MLRRNTRRSPEASRDEILAAARECFIAAGYHKTKVDDIAERAGLSKGAIYWHFDGKHELFMALLDWEIDRMMPALGFGEKAPDAQAAIHEVSEAFLREMPTTMPVIELTLEYLAQASRDEKLRERLANMYQKFCDGMSEYLTRGVTEGIFRPVDPEDVACVVVAALDGLLLQKLVRPQLDLPATWRATEDLFMKGLLAK